MLTLHDLLTFVRKLSSQFTYFFRLFFGDKRRLRQFFPLLECMPEDTDGEGRVEKDLEITARLAVRGKGGGVGGGGHPLA